MKHRIRFAVMNLKNSPLTTGLNLIGLTTAFIAFILVILYVWNEHHFDCYNRNANEIYRLETKGPGDSKTSVFLFGPTGETLKNEIPEIVASTIYLPWGKWDQVTFSWESPQGEVKSYEDYAYSDEKLTEIFSFDFIHGNTANPLAMPQTAIISESFARKAWGKNDPTGRQLTVGKSVFTIAAVFADLPENSVFESPIILKLPANGSLGESAKQWDYSNFPQFILVKSGTNQKQLTEKINNQSIVQSKYSFSNNGAVSSRLIVRPLRDLRLTDEVSDSPMRNSKPRTFINTLLGVGVLILLVALINYINFATASIPRRIKSISINRMFGSSRSYLITVIMAETMMLFLISSLLAISIAYYVNKQFAQQVIGYVLPYFQNYPLLISCVIGSLFLGAITCLYPATYCTAGKPMIKLKSFNTKNKVNFRGVLSVSQFAATIALIAVSILVIKQVRFMQETNLGFMKDGTMVIRMNKDIRKNYSSFENKLKSCPSVKDLACSRTVPGQALEMHSFNVEGKNCRLWYWAVDDHYIDLMGFSIIKGRNYLKNSEAEKGNLICNETAARQYGWKLGAKIGDGELVGILKDFNFVSLREKVEPFAFWLSGSNTSFNTISIKLSGDNVSQAIDFIGKAYTEFCPDTPFSYFFLDDHLKMLYSKENQQLKLITAFSFLSVIVSILGIFGLSTFLCLSKTKEIGIRKVNGAKVAEVMVMLNKDFIKWVAISFVIASPVAFFIMNKWLGNFAYKTHLNGWIFAVSGLVTLGIALTTVSWQSWRAATRNPVESLRYE